MPFVLALSKLVAQYLRGRCISLWDRHTAHKFIVTGIRKNKCEIDLFIPRIFEAYPSVGRNENDSSRVNIPFLRAQPNVGAACLNQQNLVLVEMFVLRDNAAWRNFLCAQPHLLRAAILAIDLDGKRCGRYGSLSGPSNAMFTFAFLEHERSCFDATGRLGMCIVPCGAIRAEKDRGKAHHA